MRQKAFGALRRFWLRMGERSRRLPMNVQRSIAIGQKASATVIEVNGELLLLGVTSSAVTLIHRWQTSSSWPVKGVVR